MTAREASDHTPTRGAPKRPRPRGTVEWSDIRRCVDEAIAHPGEWFSVPLDGRNRASASSTARTYLAAAVAEFSTVDGRLYVKFGVEGSDHAH